MGKKNSNIFINIVGGIVGISAVVGACAFAQDRVEEKKNKALRPEAGTYERYIKRPLDASLATGASLVFSPVMAVTALLVRKKLGSPILFTQERPGRIDPATGKEKIFKLYKFRSMTDEKDSNGNLLPDDVRLTSFGKKLRSTSLDELPELFNIIKGDMAVIGPRPQLVRDMVFMSPEQRQRHTVRPGLSGLAQTHGRNDTDWDSRLTWDLKYVDKVTFLGDARIVVNTLLQAFKHEGITQGEMATSEDYGDYLLRLGRIGESEYEEGQKSAKKILAGKNPYEDSVDLSAQEDLISIITPTYNCGKFIGETIESVQAQTYKNWEMVIVDDCSTDNTKEVVESYMASDPRIHYSCLSQNSGPAVARTEAMRLAQGSYMAFLDSDDLWMPDKLERQLKFMKANHYAFSATAYEQIDEESKPLGKVIQTVEKCDYNRLLLDCPIGNSTVMYDVRAMGKFEVPNIRKRNDDALWLTMLKKEQYIWGMTDVLMKYRIRKNSVSSNKLKVIKYHWILYRDIEHLSVARSLFHIGYWGVIKVLGIK